jgi:hypothetical protein
LVLAAALTGESGQAGPLQDRAALHWAAIREFTSRDPLRSTRFLARAGPATRERDHTVRNTICGRESLCPGGVEIARVSTPGR